MQIHPENQHLFDDFLPKQLNFLTFEYGKIRVKAQIQYGYTELVVLMRFSAGDRLVSTHLKL